MTEIDYTKIKAEYEASTDYALVAWAQPYFDGTKKPNNKDSYTICAVSERAAQDILELTGSDIRGFNHVITGDVIRHIEKRHGKRGTANQTMSDIADLGRISYVLNNYDYITTTGERVFGVLDRSGKPAKTVMFTKRINGHVYTAEAVTDSPKKKALYIRSMYKAPTVKKENRMVDDETPQPNVQDAYGSVTSILPQTEKNVNTLRQKSLQQQIDEVLAQTPPTFAEVAATTKTVRPAAAVNNTKKNNGKPAGNGSGNSSR